MVTTRLVLGDQYSYLLCLIDSGPGKVMEEGRLRTTEALRPLLCNPLDQEIGKAK
jgi:hypothetical protein